jgi:excisionase family DNA binding protein
MQHPRINARVLQNKSGASGAHGAPTGGSRTRQKRIVNVFSFFIFFGPTGAMKIKPTGPKDYTTGRAAHELRVSPTHVRALCQAGMIAARATRGGHWRIPRDEIQRLRKEGVPDPPPATPAETQTQPTSAPVTTNPQRHPALLAEPSQEAIASADEVVRLENEVKAIGLKRAKEEHLDWFRERERKQSEAKLARDRQVLERKTERVRRDWENSCLEFAFQCVPEDAPEAVRLTVAEAVRETLEELSPSDSEEVTGPLIAAAVDRALEPWRHSQEIESAVLEAKNQLPSWARSWSNSSLTDWELRALRAARDAIARLSNDVMFDEMRAASIAAGREIARQHEDSEARRSIVDSVFLRTPGEQEKARQAVRAALDKLPLGVSRKEMEQARDSALAPFKAAEEAIRAEAQASSQADFYLLHVDSYLQKIAADTRAGLELGSFSERHQLAEDLKQTIRPMLIQEILEEPLSLDEAHTLIESLVDHRLYY